MKSRDNESIIKTIVARHLGLDEAQVGEKDSFLDSLGADSLDAVEIVRDVEDQFKIEVPGSDIQNFDNVKQIVDYLSEKLGSS